MEALAAPSAGKTIHLLRHGQTEANIHIYSGTDDPGLFDTVLTPLGRQQAAAAAAQAAALSPPPQLLVSSPLTRYPPACGMGM